MFFFIEFHEKNDYVMISIRMSNCGKNFFMVMFLDTLHVVN